MRRQVSKEEFEKFIASSNIVTTHTVGFSTPPIKFYWNKKYSNMSFGKHSIASEELPCGYDIELCYYIHDSET